MDRPPTTSEHPDGDAPEQRRRPHPSPLRLWGFVVTLLGGTLLGVGALLPWAEVEIGGAGGFFDPEPVRGLDLIDGVIVLGAAVVILIGIPAMRQMSSRRGRRIWASLILILGLACAAIAISAAIAPDARLDAGVNAQLEEAAQGIADQTGLPASEVVRRLEEVAETNVTVEPGVWITALGGVLATAGGVLGLVWASKAPLPQGAREDPVPER